MSKMISNFSANTWTVYSRDRQKNIRRLKTNGGKRLWKIHCQKSVEILHFISASSAVQLLMTGVRLNCLYDAPRHFIYIKIRRIIIYYANDHIGIIIIIIDMFNTFLLLFYNNTRATDENNVIPVYRFFFFIIYFQRAAYARV